MIFPVTKKENHDNRARFEEHTSLAALEMSEKAAGADILQVEWRSGGTVDSRRKQGDKEPEVVVVRGSRRDERERGEEDEVKSPNNTDGEPREWPRLLIGCFSVPGKT